MRYVSRAICLADKCAAMEVITTRQKINCNFNRGSATFCGDGARIENAHQLPQTFTEQNTGVHRVSFAAFTLPVSPPDVQKYNTHLNCISRSGLIASDITKCVLRTPRTNTQKNLAKVAGVEQTRRKNGEKTYVG